MRCDIADDYGGKFAEHAPHFLEAGYRIIVPDLLSHGRSTGLHAYVLNVSPLELETGRQRDAFQAEREAFQMEDVAAGVDAVICDVALKDMERAGKTEATINERKLFAAGSSMGGFTALLYALYVPGHRPLGRDAASDMLTHTLRQTDSMPRPHFQMQPRQEASGPPSMASSGQHLLVSCSCVR